MTAEIIADSATSLAAAAGLVLVIRRMRAERDHPLTRRFRGSLGLLAALMVVRVLFWASGWEVFRVLTIACAGAIPLAAVILAEGLLRRHAPPALKWLAAGGALAFAVSALVPAPLVEPWRTTALMAFQLVLLALVGAMAALRDRASLSAEENRAVQRILLSLLLILPLLAGDFRTPYFDQPVRSGAITILGLAWLSLGLGHARGRIRMIVLGFLAVLGLAIAIGVLVGSITGAPLRAMIQISAIVLSALLLMAIALEAHALKTEARADTVMRHLAHGTLAGPRAFLAELQRQSGVEEAALLEGSDLADFDADILRAIFTAEPVQTTSSARHLPPVQREQIDWLLSRFEATHVLLVAETPLTLLALNRPAISGADVAALELKAVQRMASLLAARDPGRPI